MATKLKQAQTEEIIARVVLIPKSHWAALGQHAKDALGKRDGRSVIVRKLVAQFLSETGTLRKMKAQAKRRNDKAAATRKANAAAAKKAATKPKTKKAA